jgi:hypothetical protein
VKAEDIRAAMGPEMCTVADALRDTFGAKLVYLDTLAVKIGKDPSEGSVRASGKPDEELEQLRYWYGRRA